MRFSWKVVMIYKSFLGTEGQDFLVRRNSALVLRAFHLGPKEYENSVGSVEWKILTQEFQFPV